MNSLLDQINYPKKVLEIAEKLLDKLLGPALVESGELIADKIRLYRFKNQIKILNKVKKLMDENNLQPKQIPLKLVVPLLENASLEENESLQDMWARLIMNTSVSDYRVGWHKVCVSILSELSPTEAKILEMVKKDVVKKLEENYSKSLSNEERGKLMLPFVFYHHFRYDITRNFSLKQEDGDFIVDNLVRLGILKWSASDVEDSTIDLEEWLEVSHLGFNFIKECTDLKDAFKLQSNSD